MEIGEEISKKIRTAIKAKLVDLGAYVDDELPDYIMVMVANRKTQPQMTEDLNLFLGNHTDAFTTWLHGLLEKLQSITADPLEEPTKKATETAPVPVKTPEKETEVSTKEKEGHPQKPAEKPPSEKPDQVEPVINLNPEHDEFEEVKTTESLDKTKSKEQKTKRRRSSADEKKRSHDKHGSSSSKSSKDREKQPSKSSSSKDPEISRKESTLNTRPSVASRLGPRRKAGSLVSSIGAVIKHDVEISDDEYDPLNPSVGAVASIVKVTERKSTLPPDKQANKSLLFKAMNDAEKSVTTKKQTGKVAEKPESTRSRGDGRDRESNRRRHERERDREARHSSSSSHARSSRMDEERKYKKESVIDRLGGKRPSVMSRLGGDKSPSKPGADFSDRHVEIVRKVKQEPRERKRRSDSDLRSRIGGSSKTTNGKEQEALKTKRRKTDGDGSNTIDLTMEEDSRRIKYERKDYSPQPDDVRRIQAAESDGDAFDVLIESDVDNFDDFSDVDISENYGTRGMNEQSMDAAAISESIHSEDKQKRKEDEPKFVVTLDGVDPVNLAEESERVIPSAVAYPYRPEITPAPKNVVMVRPQPPAVEPVTISLSDLEEGEDDDVRPSPNAKTAKAEKCRFFPACKNGEQCPFVHPTSPCTNFPDCRFGDRCLYIHPDCKFDSACTRPNCPFTHTSKKNIGAPTAPGMPPLVLQPIGVPFMYPRPPVPRVPPMSQPRASHPSEVTCRFFPRCTNMSCPFKHPKPCRYGMGCTEKETCRFSHPTLPSANKLKWTPQLAMAAQAAQQAAGQTSTAEKKLPTRATSKPYAKLATYPQ